LLNNNNKKINTFCQMLHGLCLLNSQLFLFQLTHLPRGFVF
jgi:hypothetical protein